jgi:hypothetical protein
MFRVGSAFALGLLMCQPVLADQMDVARQRYYQYRHYLPAERHVIEVVQPPYSGNFIINGARFTGVTPACFNWVAGERIRLIAGDWNARCMEAVFYNFYRRNSCVTLCRPAWW